MQPSPKTPLIIAFGYKAQSGKGESAETIRRSRSTFSGHIGIFSFATALRDEIHGAVLDLIEKTGVTPQLALQELCSKFGVTYDENAKVDKLNPWGKQRALQQYWGTEYRRAQDPQYWVKKLHTSIADSCVDIALIDDMRFPNEYAWADTNGYTVKVERRDFAGLEGDAAMHSSETSLDGYDFDYYISAGADGLAELRAQALHVFDTVLELFQTKEK
jgi:hypothetical protein